MKVKAINRSEEACTRERASDLRKVLQLAKYCVKLVISSRTPAEAEQPEIFTAHVQWL